jgi:hypothetical protein
MVQIKHGIVYLDKLHQHINNVKLILLVYIYHFLKIFKKYYYQNIQNNKDGILFMYNGWI